MFGLNLGLVAWNEMVSFVLMRIRSLLLVLLGLVTMFSLPVSAEPPGSTVKKVNYEAKTVEIELYRREQGTKVVTIYKIDMGCTFTLDDVPCKFKQIHRGQHVVGLTEGDPGVLDALHVQSAN
jgi:hypothetical protein